VDYICTHQYTFTLSAPVRCAGRFIGVAGADILAAQVERLALPALHAQAADAVLVSAAGRVIASTAAAITPGMIAPPGRVIADLGTLPWQVRELATPLRPLRGPLMDPLMDPLMGRKGGVISRPSFFSIMSSEIIDKAIPFGKADV
jgi:hypothetical protein